MISLYKKLNSKILSAKTEKGRKQFQMIYSNLSKPKELKLLFRGSEHNFKAKAFHQNCDNIHNTLTVVRT